ncbi:MAG: hypothetical protein ACE5NG_02190 [bacterium]
MTWNPTVTEVLRDKLSYHLIVVINRNALLVTTLPHTAPPAWYQSTVSNSAPIVRNGSAIELQKLITRMFFIRSASSF